MKHLARMALMSAVLVPVALAQHQPYAGEEVRDIKALSAEEVKQYLAGAGMGYAKAARSDGRFLPPHRRGAVAVAIRPQLT